jgi:nicotinamide riboside kinase
LRCGFGEQVMYVRQMQGADMRGREDLVAELTDHVEMIEDKLRSAAESEARKEVYVELVEEDTAKAAIQIKQVSGITFW